MNNCYKIWADCGYWEMTLYIAYLLRGVETRKKLTIYYLALTHTYLLLIVASFQYVTEWITWIDETYSPYKIQYTLYYITTGYTAIKIVAFTQADKIQSVSMNSKLTLRLD